MTDRLEVLAWQETFDAMDDLVAVLDREFRIVKVNRAMAAHLRRAAADLVGVHCFEVMHGRDTPWPGCPHREMLERGRSSTAEVDDQHIGIPLLVTASPVLDTQGRLLGSVHVARDISALKKTQAELEARNRELDILWRIAREAQRGLSLDTVVRVTLEGLRESLEPDLALFYRMEGDFLVLAGAWPPDAGDLNERKRVGDCLCGLAAADGVAVYARDIFADTRCTLRECKDAGMHSFAAIPVLQDGVVVGVIGLASRAERDFAARRAFLETVAATVAASIRNAILHERLLEHSGRLDEKVRERTADLVAKNAELERFNKLFVDREFRIKELKEQVNELERERHGTKGSRGGEGAGGLV